MTYVEVMYQEIDGAFFCSFNELLLRKDIL